MLASNNAHRAVLSSRSQTHERRRATPPRAFLKDLFNFAGSKTKPAEASLKKLLAIVADTDRGLNTSKEQLAAIKQCFVELEELGPSGTEANIKGTWKLLWTTEQETLFILKNASFFKTRAEDVFQVIDTAAGSLQNVITFPPEGAFIVDSSLEWAGDSRTNFKFTKATLKLPNDKAVNLPPFGQGWFDSIYVDSKFRLNRDVRGDLLITVREGPPREFK